VGDDLYNKITHHAAPNARRSDAVAGTATLELVRKMAQDAGTRHALEMRRRGKRNGRERRERDIKVG
jgi:hypothetical protein